MKISIIGSGVVGKATGIGFCKIGYKVIFYDIDSKKIHFLKENGYDATEEIEKAISQSDISFVCVPTPTVKGKMITTHLENAIINIREELTKKKDLEYHLIVIRSTILPTTTKKIVIPLLEKGVGLKVGKNLGICTNPEFMRQKKAQEDFDHPWRIVIGEYDRKSGDILANLYDSFKAPIIRTDIETAELIKYASNCYLSTKISFFNEMFLICEKFNINSQIVSKAVSLDPRIGEYGIYGGHPFEGSCLPKDLESFIEFLKDNLIQPTVLEAVQNVNKKMIERK
jgi:UDPglucose 6-dehydrogenase